MTQLIPQIPAGVAESLLSQLAHSRSADLDPGDELRIPQAITQPTGGMPITDALLKELRVSIVSSARNHGFPDSRRRASCGSNWRLPRRLQHGHHCG